MGLGKFLKDFGKGLVSGVQGANYVDRWSNMRLDVVYQEVQQVVHQAVMQEKPELIMVIAGGIYEAWLETHDKNEQDHLNEIAWMLKYEIGGYQN